MQQLMQSTAKKEVLKKVSELLNAEFKEFDDDSCLNKLID